MSRNTFIELTYDHQKLLDLTRDFTLYSYSFTCLLPRRPGDHHEATRRHFTVLTCCVPILARTFETRETYLLISPSQGTFGRAISLFKLP
jgi:hypothetical protein